MAICLIGGRWQWLAGFPLVKIGVTHHDAPSSFPPRPANRRQVQTAGNEGGGIREEKRKTETWDTTGARQQEKDNALEIRCNRRTEAQGLRGGGEVISLRFLVPWDKGEEEIPGPA